MSEKGELKLKKLTHEISKLGNGEDQFIFMNALADVKSMVENKIVAVMFEDMAKAQYKSVAMIINKSLNSIDND